MLTTIEEIMHRVDMHASEMHMDGITLNQGIARMLCITEGEVVPLATEASNSALFMAEDISHALLLAFAMGVEVCFVTHELEHAS